MKPFKLKMQMPSESSEGAALIHWKAAAMRQYPELQLLFHVPNGGARDIQTAARMKREGVVPGVPDYLLLVPRSGYHGMALELKRRDGGVLSGAQITMMELLSDHGYYVVIANGWESAKELILQYLNGSVGNDRARGAD